MQPQLNITVNFTKQDMNNLEALKYPVGRFAMPGKITAEDAQEYIRTLGSLPAELAKTVENFDDAKYDTRYRENGWTVRQVITHIAEAHARAYAMFTRGLAENNLTGKTHPEKALDFGDGQRNTIQAALQTIYGVHERWVADLKSLTDHELNSRFFYPDANRMLSFPEFLAIFAWHTRHHLAHITGVKDRMGW